MRRIRFLAILLIVWFLFFFNIERLSEPIDITDTAYGFMAFIVVVAIAIPRLNRMPPWAFLASAVPSFLALRLLTGNGIWGTALPSATTEACAVAITSILAYFLSVEMHNCELAITRSTIGVPNKPEPFSLGQGVIYREVKRARDYQRPLTMMAVGVEDESIRLALDRLTREVLRSTTRQFALASVSKTLCDIFEDYNIIAQRKDHFLVLLPEVTAQQLPDLIDHLRQEVTEQVGVTLRVGTASFPDDGLTFDGMVDKAILRMQGTTSQGEQGRQTPIANAPGEPATEDKTGTVSVEHLLPSREVADGLGDNQPA